MVHLSLAASTGPGEAAALFGALDAVAAPVVSAWGPADAERPGRIRLDPPAGAALGGGRWLRPDRRADSGAGRRSAVW